MPRPRVIGLLLALATLLAYLPATHDRFINYDDDDYITQNQVVQKGLTWTGVKWAFTTWHASNWHPLTWLSHMTDCELFHLNPGGHHFVNVLFHAANATLLFMLLLSLTDALWPSAFIAALFAWHPLHVESVAWVSERKDVLSTFFALLALLSYVRFARENRRRNFWLAVIFFALGFNVQTHAGHAAICNVAAGLLAFAKDRMIRNPETRKCQAFACSKNGRFFCSRRFHPRSLFWHNAMKPLRRWRKFR